MNKIRKCLFVLTVLCITLTVSMNAFAKVKINKTKAAVTVGQTIRLKITGTGKKTKWSSSNKKIASVSAAGYVKGVGKGSCVITAKVGKKKFKCIVSVKRKNLSENEAWRAMQRHIDEIMGMNMLTSHGGFVCCNGKKGANYKYTVRWYTGAYSFFYINAKTGAIYQQDRDFFTYEDGPLYLVSNAYNYLP